MRDTLAGGIVAPRLEFQILGPLEIRCDGELARVGGPRQRALLALLLCNANHVVSKERLIDELLSDQANGTADHALRVQISRLRKALAAPGDRPRVLAQAPGYVLRVEPDELDLDAFERHLAEGRRALEDGDPARAAVRLTAAGALWRGRPLADLEYEPFARFEVQRLEELRLLAIEERIEAELALGRHTGLCPELETLVAEYPLRERLREQLMLALYRSGRQADALSSYQAGRSRLVDELALEPGPQLRQLERAILMQDPTLELPRPASPSAMPSAVADPNGDAGVGPSPHHRRRHQAWRAGLVLGIAAVLTAIGILAPDLGASTPRHKSRNDNLLALVMPGRDTPAATVPLAAPPTDVAWRADSLWVAEPSAGLVVRIDVKRREVAATIPVGTRPSRIVTTGEQVWVLDPVDGTASRINPDTDTVAQTIAVGTDPSDLAVSGGSLWIANRREGTITRKDPRTGLNEQVVRTGGDPTGLATAPGAVWVADDESGMVERIDARTGAIRNRIRVGDAPTAIATTPTSVWVLDPLDATLSRVDPRRDAVVATVALGGAPAAVAASAGGVWVADGTQGTVTRVDPRRAVVEGSVVVGGDAAALSAAGGLWVATDRAGPSHRGGTLTAAPSSQVIDTVDPAASTSTNVLPPEFFGMTNDGLVTIDHVPGPGGTRLVPDLALALPLPANGGRTYTFRVRSGIRYSTGTPIKASDVRRSFERLFAIDSSGADWYQSIVGASACLRRPAGCNLSQGIITNERARSVTFNLTHPDPDFLYKLTLTYADVLPGSTPDSQARGPLPATGPYEASRYVPGREVLLTRNPRFREWSAAAQPDGYPNRVLLRLDIAGASGARSVAARATDFTANVGQIPDPYAEYFLRHHPGQVHVNPLMETSFMFLNVRTPPFDDIRVRRALNLALNRNSIVNSYGGPVAARPTCQVLPPGIAGYRAYCPYTRNPTGNGRWHSPNLSRARRLVASSGTAGMKVTVWNIDGPPRAAVDETRAAVTALDQLGYHARLRLLPDSTYFTYTNDSRNRAQVIDGGWSADYASANDFISKLTCGYFRRADGPATTDASEYCAPALDQQIGRADVLQVLDPQAAAARWTHIDRELTNLAIWLPTVTPNEVDLVARSIGNYQYNPVWGVLLDQLWRR